MDWLGSSLTLDPVLLEAKPGPRPSGCKQALQIISTQADRFLEVRVYLCRTTRVAVVREFCRRRSLCQKPRGWPMRLTEWANRLRSGCKVVLTRQADHSAKLTKASRPLLRK